MSLMIDQDNEDLLNGTITPERMMENWKARANGAALGLLIAFGFEAFVADFVVAAPVAGLTAQQTAHALSNDRRVMHALSRLVDAGVYQRTTGADKQAFLAEASRILQAPVATFSNILRGPVATNGFIGTIGNQTVAIQVFAEGPYAGQIATAVVPTANQLALWGVH